MQRNKTGDWLLRLDSYEAGRCQAPLVFSALEHTSIDAATLIPNEGGAAAVFDNDNDQDTPLGLTATLKSWRFVSQERVGSHGNSPVTPAAIRSLVPS